MEGTKNIAERRQLRAELRDLKAKKETLTDENGNETKAPSKASKFTMAVNSSEKERYQERAKHINREESPARKENVAPQQPKSAKSTFNFKVSNTEEKTSESRPAESTSWRRQANHVKSNIEEKKPRKNQEVNNNDDVKKEKEKEDGAPQRMSRRTSLAELFKIDQEALQKSRAQANAPAPQLAVSPARMIHHRQPLETHQDTKTKQDLLHNLGKLRGRRRSVREIERKEELEGLMYVKSGDTVKLVNTSEGDEQVKEQRKIRRNSRKESHDKLKIEGNTISSHSETELTAIQESPRTPKSSQPFEFTNVEPPKKTEPPKTRIWQPPPRTEAPKPGPAGRPWNGQGPQKVGPPRPNALFPAKKEVSCEALPRSLHAEK